MSVSAVGTQHKGPSLTQRLSVGLSKTYGHINTKLYASKQRELTATNKADAVSKQAVQTVANPIQEAAAGLKARASSLGVAAGAKRKAGCEPDTNKDNVYDAASVAQGTNDPAGAVRASVLIKKREDQTAAAMPPVGTHAKADHKAQEILQAKADPVLSKENNRFEAQAIPANVAVAVQDAFPPVKKTKIDVSTPPEGSGAIAAAPPAAIQQEFEIDKVAIDVKKGNQRIEYTNIKRLTKGALGKVHFAVQRIFENELVSERDVALKLNLSASHYLKRLPTHMPEEERALKAKKSAEFSLTCSKSEFVALQKLAQIRNAVELIDHFDLVGEGVEGVVHYVLVLPYYEHCLRAYGAGVKPRAVFGFEDFCHVAKTGLDTLIDLKAQRLVHRDIKPGNLFFDPTSKSIKFGDWGGVMSVETAGNHVGQTTPNYIATEMWIGAPCNHLLDVWSFGVTLFEIFTGKKFASFKTNARPLMNPDGTPKIDKKADAQLVAQQIGFPPTPMIEAAGYKKKFFKQNSDGSYDWAENLLATDQLSKKGNWQWVRDVQLEGQARGLPEKTTSMLVMFLKRMISYDRHEPEMLAQDPFLKLHLIEMVLASAAKATAAAK